MTGDRIDKMDYIHEEEKVGGVRKTELSVKSTAAWRRVGREKRRNQKKHLVQYVGVQQIGDFAG